MADNPYPNKVVFGGETVIDLTSDTVDESHLAAGYTAHNKSGKQITGNVYTVEGQTIFREEVDGYYTTISIENGIFIASNRVHQNTLLESDAEFQVVTSADNLGDATAEDVVSGKTFTSASGLKVTGTHECAGGTTPTLQSKTVTPSESEQTVSPDSGYDGLSSVTVDAVSNTYIGSGVTKKSAQTYTPGTADQTIAAGQYLSGAQTIKGDANLVAGNIKSGVSIFGVAGTYVGSGGSGGGIQAQHITSADEAITISGSGTVKVWGYGHKSSGYMGTTYSFVGDGYYSGSYGMPSKKSATFSINNGKLSGLPSGLTAVDLLVTIGT